MEIAGFVVKPRYIKVAIAVILLVVGILVLTNGLFGKNNIQDFTVCQPIAGQPWIEASSGIYWKWFSSTWSYPKYHQVFFSKNTDEGGKLDQSIRATFSDGGEADISVMVRYQNPEDAAARMMLHDNFRGVQNDITMAVRSHISNCIKSTGPMMSSSEHQSARKSEFNQLVEEQLRNGLYAMKRVDKMIDDPNAPTALLVDTAGETGAMTRRAETHKVVQSTTEIVRDKDGKPLIAQESPLQKFGIKISQFSVTRTDYDDKTREMFSAKKESYLIAEKMKAQRQEEIANRMMVIEKGLREKASVEADANKKKAEQTINAELSVVLAEQAKLKAEKEAQQLVTVAAQKKLEAETQAQQLVTVAAQTKLAAETKAQQDLAVATFDAQAAEQKALAVKVLALAEKERIGMAGAITEKEQKLAEIDANARVKIASALASISSPGTLIIGGGQGGNGGGDLMQSMLSLFIMEKVGVLKPNSSKTVAAADKVAQK
ncbi:MAG: SPFH domain-containing protein [Candidatus Bathyarchaeota archaeon]|nr:SPFH domain-containing protein [Candidatus Bathyarchaeota archaeon]